MKVANWLIVLFSLFVICSIGNSVNAQVTKLVGEQIRKSNEAQAVLKCFPVKITRTMQITKVTGSSNGFWIQKESETIHKFLDPKKAIGIKLKPGTYYVYPYFKTNKLRAKVEVVLK